MTFDPIELHVSPKGDDAHSGTKDQPFATLKRARDAARELRGGIWTELFWRDPKNSGRNHELYRKRLKIPERTPVKIFLHGGIHRLSEPITLNADDAGTQDHPVVWKALTGESPIVTGSVTLEGWEPWKDGIWRAPLPSHLPDLINRYFFARELHYRGERQIRSRYPKYDPNNPRRGGFLLPTKGDDAEPYRGFYLPKSFDRQYARPDEAELNIAGGHGGWCNNIIPVSTIDHPTGRIRLARDPIKLAWAPWAMVTHLGQGNRFYFENMLEDIEQPGEWCLSHHEGMIYFKPLDGDAFDPTQVELPVLGQLIAMEGVEHVRFEDITFRGVRNLGDNLHREGNSGYGAMLAQPDWAYCGEAIHVAWSSHIHFDQCHIDQVGGNGIYFERLCRRCQVTRSTLSNVGANPIVFIGDRHDHPFSCEVSDCHIYDGGDLLNYVAGVFCGVSDGIRILHNHIHHMPHHAVNLGSNGRGRNYVEHNRIEHVTLEIADTGAINSWMDDACKPGEPSSEYIERSGHVIRHNLIKHVRGCIVNHEGQITYDRTARGIYIDDGTSNCVVSDNIIVDAHTGMQIHAGRHNVVENNFFIDTMCAVMFCNDPANRRGSGFTYQMLRANRFVNNILFSRRDKHTMFYAPEEYHDQGALFWFTQTASPPPDEVLELCDHNVYFFAYSKGLRVDIEVENETGSEFDRISVAQWQHDHGHDLYSKFEDPQFVNVDEEDFSFEKTSPAFDMGIRSIDVSTIGIRH